MNAQNEFGCLMAMIPDEYAKHLVNFNKAIIPEADLYTVPGDDSYGYETEPHVTLKYGFIPDLKRTEIAALLKTIKPFTVTLTGISQFNNPEFHVVKFDVTSPVLHGLRKYADQYPNQDRFKEYHPHMTIGYKKPTTRIIQKNDVNITLPVNRFKYSGMNGEKLYINI